MKNRTRLQFIGEKLTSAYALSNKPHAIPSCPGGPSMSAVFEVGFVGRDSAVSRDLR